jgi:hypothetical protein
MSLKKAFESGAPPIFVLQDWATYKSFGSTLDRP